jgi:iron complex outermembrane receptor protein
LYENVEDQQAWGVYLQDVLTLTPQWQLLVGLRLDDYQQTITERVKNTVARTDDQQISPRAGLTYRLNEQIMLYSNYAEGFLPLSGTDYAGNAFAPERSESLEFGVKGQHGDWRWSAAWFDADKSNILVSDPVNVGFSATLGAAQSRGIELELAGALTDSSNLSLAYSWLDSETLKDALNPDWGVLVKKGSALVNVPRHTLNAQWQQAFSLAGRESSAGVRLRYQSKRLGDAVVPDYQLPSHTLWHLFATHRLSPALQAELVVENLLDKSWIQSSYSALWTYPGEPRSTRLSLRYDF